MERILLNGIWKLHGRDEKGISEDIPVLETAVPGLAQLTLSENGFLPSDLYMGENIRSLEKYESYEWWYERDFEVSEAHKHAFLVFRGVDCMAEYFLNGEKIGESDNMFIPFEFDVSEKLKVGKNSLCVHITSPTAETHKGDYDLYSIFSTWNSPTNTKIRRAPHSYGWDIMPRAVTSGIWRDVYLEFRDDIYFTQVFFDCGNPSNIKFHYDTSSNFADWNNVEIEVEGECGDSTFSVRKKARGKAGIFYIPIKNPKLWWPYGYGKANIYETAVRIYSDGKLVHEYNTHFGNRTVKLERTETTDGENGYFRFIVNGSEIMAKGSSWVPLDAFHSRDKERYSKALELVKDIGCNILRCWGGNVYEDHEFFDFCDRNGVMVWQDFAMACATYPQDDEFAEMLRREATSVVREYRNHPSIILWSGDNEVDQFVFYRGIKPSANRLTREVLPEVVFRNDRGRPYLESSPYMADSLLETKGIYAPEDHAWGPRDYYKSDFYKQYKAHFISETGYHGCPSLESIKKFITPEKVWPYAYNPEWKLHSTDYFGDYDRVMLMERQVRQLFGEVPKDPEDYILASQISQAEANKYLIERMRADRPKRSGIIWWNLLDGWPQMSDAIVDYYFEKKLAYRYVKRSQAPFTIVANEIRSWESRIIACNDTLEEKRGTFKIYDVTEKRTRLEKEFVAAPNRCTDLVRIPLYYSDKNLIVITWELENGEKGINHYLAGSPAFSLAQYKQWLEEGWM